MQGVVGLVSLGADLADTPIQLYAVFSHFSLLLAHCFGFPTHTYSFNIKYYSVIVISVIFKYAPNIIVILLRFNTIATVKACLG